jgi:hypothetical protein
MVIFGVVAASIFRAKVGTVRKWMVYMEIKGGSGQGYWDNYPKDYHLFSHSREKLKSFNHMFVGYLAL